MAAFAVSTRFLAARRVLRVVCLLAAGVTALATSGCTVFGPKQPPTLKSTTSAEQYERIFWAKARKERWKEITPLLATNVVYAVDGKVLSRGQIIPFLESRRMTEFAIGDMAVKPNGSDMTLSYSVQVTSPGHPLQSLIAVSVWQQLKSGWILIAHSEQPQATAIAGK